VVVSRGSLALVSNSGNAISLKGSHFEAMVSMWTA
jgi:hypothetical protein